MDIAVKLLSKMERLLMLCLCASSLSAADASRVYAEADEVWLTRNGETKMLTNDGKAKLQAVLSTPGDRIAYYEQCPQDEHCLPSVVILDLVGKRLQEFHPQFSLMPEPCASILRIAWVRADAVVGVECHNTPSSSLYLEVDLATGKNVRELAGLWFTPSPDGKRVAHVGPLIHFAPQNAKSHYLLFDEIVVYPLRKRVKPFVFKGYDEASDVVRENGTTYSGIHDIAPQLAWSPDLNKVAFIDCVYDWTDTEGAGSESNRRCSVAAVSLTGKFVRFPLRDIPVESIHGARLSWLDAARLQFQLPARSSGRPSPPRTFTVPR